MDLITHFKLKKDIGDNKKGTIFPIIGHGIAFKDANNETKIVNFDDESIFERLRVNSDLLSKVANIRQYASEIHSLYDLIINNINNPNQLRKTKKNIESKTDMMSFNVEELKTLICELNRTTIFNTSNS